MYYFYNFITKLKCFDMWEMQLLAGIDLIIIDCFSVIITDIIAWETCE